MVRELVQPADMSVKQFAGHSQLVQRAFVYRSAGSVEQEVLGQEIHDRLAYRQEGEQRCGGRVAGLRKRGNSIKRC